MNAGVKRQPLSVKFLKQVNARVKRQPISVEFLDRGQSVSKASTAIGWLLKSIVLFPYDGCKHLRKNFHVLLKLKVTMSAGHLQIDLLHEVALSSRVNENSTVLVN